jgi:hypothetical protein
MSFCKWLKKSGVYLLGEKILQKVVEIFAEFVFLPLLCTRFDKENNL